MSLILHRLDRCARAFAALAREPAADGASRPVDNAVDNGVIGGAVDLQHVEPGLGRGGGGDLPIAEMRGEEDEPGLRRPRGDDLAEALDDDATARLVELDLAEMRIFGDDAAEIIPHAGDDGFDTRIVELRHGAMQVDPCALAGAEARADVAGKPAAEIGGVVERQQAEKLEGKPNPDALDGVAPALP